MAKEQKENKITAIVQTYNCEDFLCNVLESLKDFDETIIVDSHSTDDTVQIAQEYRAKIIYADKVDLAHGLNQALNEASGEWIFFVEKNEIIPEKLALEVNRFIELNEVAKKPKSIVSLSKKVFYKDREIKPARQKQVVRLIKKEVCSFDENCSIQYSKNLKIHKLNKNFRLQNASIFEFIKIDICENISELIEKNRIKLKRNKYTKSSVIVKPCLVFAYWYLLKGLIFKGKIGFIYSKMRYIDEFILQNMILENSLKEEENDF